MGAGRPGATDFDAPWTPTTMASYKDPSFLHTASTRHLDKGMDRRSSCTFWEVGDAPKADRYRVAYYARGILLVVCATSHPCPNFPRLPHLLLQELGIGR